jgi:hypothetical protein
LDSFKENNIINYYEIIIVIGGYYDIQDYEIHKKEVITYIPYTVNNSPYSPPCSPPSRTEDMVFLSLRTAVGAKKKNKLTRFFDCLAQSIGSVLE